MDKDSDIAPGPSRRRPASAAPGRLRHALRNAFIDGMLSSFTGAIVETFAIAAILSLGAGNRSVAALAGLAALLSALAQLFSPWLTARAPSRRFMVVSGARLQAGACLLFATAGFLAPAGRPGAAATLAIAVAILGYAAYSVAGSIPRGAWASWMSDIVPRSGRGRHFSWRGMWLGAIYGATAMAVGQVFRIVWGPGITPAWPAFATLLAAAGASRFLASAFAARQFEPPAAARAPDTDFTYWQFLKRTGRSNFATYTVCLAVLVAGGSLTGPFFQVYFLRDLKGLPIDGLAGAIASAVGRGLAALGMGDGPLLLTFDLSTYALLPTTALLSRLLFIRFWGRVADRSGNLRVMRICAIFLALIPFLYMGKPSFLFMFLGWVVGGIVWGGLDLASFNYVMEAVTPARRVRCFAYMEGTMGMAVALTAFTGGWLAEHLPPFCGYRLQSLFLVSVALRLLPALGLLVFVREVRNARHPIPPAGRAREPSAENWKPSQPVTGTRHPKGPPS